LFSFVLKTVSLDGGHVQEVALSSVVVVSSADLVRSMH
jgi:hypothetical protein